MSAREWNFDGLVGPTHHYAGLSPGNVASAANAGSVSRPRDAARQGLAKMRGMIELGLAQGVLPPLERPDLGLLRAVGFEGDDATILARAAREDHGVLASAMSASSMWTANAATVSPSADTGDGRLHVTPANLASNLHRSIEARPTTTILRSIFRDPARFAVHDPLPATPAFFDEGAANHTRLAPSHGVAGLEVFVYGRVATWAIEAGGATKGPRRFPARQTREASQAIARRHGVAPERTMLEQQRAASIDAGVFHNDVIAVGNESVLLHHELAWERPGTAGKIAEAYELLFGETLSVVEISAEELSIEDAVATYLFNSQLVTLPDGCMALVAPAEAREHPRASACIERIVSSGSPIAEARFFDLRQSMRNGGGPACLRLRVVMTEEEQAALAPGVRMDAERITALEAWVDRHYREELAPGDLADPRLLAESRTALDELTGLLGLGSIYPFQH